MPQPDETRLNDLKQRWAQDPGSRLYLQLADEHRKHGQLEEAEAVLVKGLDNRPGDLSGLVALGRARLELAKLEEAAEALGSVVARDPAHLVANKLLLETHLQRGDAAKADERLEICRLLNDRDPELEHLEYRLGQLRSLPQEREELPHQQAADETPSLDDLEFELEGAASVADVEDVELEEVDDLEFELEETPTAFDVEDFALEDVADGPRPARERGEDVAEARPSEQDAVAAEPAARDEEPFAFLTERVAAERQPEHEIAADPEPAAEDAEESPMPSPSTIPSSNGEDIFALGEESPEIPTLESLWIEHASPERRADPFAGLNAVSTLAPGDIFRFAPPPAAAGSPGPEELAAEPAAENEEAVTWESTSGEPVVYQELNAAAGSDLMLDTQRTRFTLEDARPVVEEPSPADAGAERLEADPAETAEPAPLTERPPADEPAVETGADAASPVEADVDAAAPVDTAAGVAAPAETATEAASPAETEDRVATVALGNLYLDQGHVEEAVRIFSEVLKRDPENAAALAGLRRARPPRDRRLQAGDLMADPLSGSIPAGTTAKKLLVLTNYLRHLRTARDRDHVH